MRKRGVTLIMVAGVLAVLSALGAGFYVVAVSQQKSAVRYSDSVHAELMAQAGIQDGMARLRDSAFQKIEDTSDRWYTVDYLHGAAKQISFAASDYTQKDKAGGPLKLSYSRAVQNSTGDPGSDNFTLEIQDASSKINVNACDNLGVLLDNLCRVVGPPLVAADVNRLQPRIWATLGAQGYDTNPDDKKEQGACYYMPTKAGDNLHIDPLKTPKLNADTSAMYGDGYAIARYRAVNGKFKNITDVKNALTVSQRLNHPELETLERELKFSVLRDYITIDSWVDTNTVCTGKFEWINDDICIDRDKSWIEDDPSDKKNLRGSLRGSYVSILTGQGAGQLRRIETNGVDWIKIKPGFMKVSSQGGQPVSPGPLSTYMIVAKEDALLDKVATDVELPREDGVGNLVDDPDIDYERYPLCIHRAPININTASDKVLTAMFMGINITHGHYMSIGTEVDVDATYDAWYKPDSHGRESRISTLSGLKRIPVSSGKIIYDKPFKSIVPSPLPSGYNVDYINNYGGTPSKGNVTEAHELALRVILARQSPVDPKTGQAKPGPDPYNSINSKNKNGYKYDYLTGPFKSWDDFYFRVVQPWDELRFENDPKRGRAAPLIMAHFNSNTDILKFNPGIEWIDRWGRNFTEMEPVMTYQGNDPIWATINDPDYGTSYSAYITRNMRYKADEVIDKTDVNRGTTEFCFDSGGIFEIRSTGRVMKGGVVKAERRVEALVQVYDVWRESTQRQFVQGTISEAATNARDGTLEDFNRSGKPVRDSTNRSDQRLALDTLPEPLVPISYKLKSGGRNVDVVDTGAPNGRGIYGTPKPADGTPDIVYNRVQPASYDGQIVLATNTSRYGEGNEEKNTFLASFNGDLDTDTSVGNGREQAKSPGDRMTRVSDTCSLLGVLNDVDEKHIDYDVQDGTVGNYNTFRLPGYNQGLKPLQASNYWEGVTCRQGDLRAEGLWIGYCGVSGNDGTVKYLVDNVGGSGASAKRKNFNPEDGAGATNGATISMWVKTVWAADDNRYHEFFNADNPGPNASARYFALVKGQGQPQSPDSNGLTASFEDKSDNDCQGALYGGLGQDPLTRYKNNPAFRIQPFRWCMVGGLYKYNTPVVAGGDFQGYGYASNPTRNQAVLDTCRPFISTARDPNTKQAMTEGPLWKQDWFSSRLNAAVLSNCDIGASVSGASYNQQAQWDWADGGGGGAGAAVFGVNNLNKNPNMWLYRYSPIDGTLAVVDELKLSKSMWSKDLAARVLATSRYYLPANPDDPGQCPTFTSQSLLHSLRGTNGGKATLDTVEPVRIAWNCFTPRFMHEVIPAQSPAGGPFNYEQYNLGILDPNKLDKQSDPFGVFRPTMQDYQKKGAKQSHAVSGIEVELLNDTRVIEGSSEESPGKFVTKSTFTDPNVLNRFPIGIKPVSAQNLRYRVRFRYPIDPYFGGGTIKPSSHYLLDTPVFDDISITYTIPARIINFRNITE